MLIRFFELLSLNRLEISKMDIAENLIWNSGQKEVFNLSKRMGEKKKRKEKCKSDCLWFRIGKSFQFL